MYQKKKISSILKKADSLVNIFKYYLKKNPNKKIFFKKQNNNWVSQSYFESYENIKKIKNFLRKHNVNKGDRVFLLSNNRIEWVEFDIAIMDVGGITVPSFVTNNQNDNAFIIKNSAPKVIILENDEVFKNNKKVLNNYFCPIITIEKSNYLRSYEDIMTDYSRLDKKNNHKSTDISSIIYTSGTTGNPKGVVLSHKSILHNLEGALEVMNDFKIEDEKFFSFLPLSHSYERMAGLYFPILINAEIYFCSSMEKLLSEIKEVQPTIFSAVPRLYENIFKKIKSQIVNSNFILSFCLRKVFEYLEKKRNRNNFFNISVAKIFIFFLKKKILLIFGGKVKVLVSGGAALNPEIGFFFNKVGLNLLQGYGQTEASPLISCNNKISNNPYTVGIPVKGVKVKISNTGEILVKGNNLMNGYWKNKKLSNKTIIKGWLHTGDLGEIDNQGRLLITGRKKDLIVTSGGDNISAIRIENIFLSFNEISQILIFGDNRPYLVALVKINDGYNEKDFKIILDKINKKLNLIERIRKYIIFKNELNYANGFMTQTMKIKRKSVFSFYKKKIDNLYGIL